MKLESIKTAMDIAEDNWDLYLELSCKAQIRHDKNYFELAEQSVYWQIEYLKLSGQYLNAKREIIK